MSHTTKTLRKESYLEVVPGEQFWVCSCSLIILINLIGFNDQQHKLGNIITKPMNKRKPMKNIHLKFVDNMTVAESLKKQLVSNPNMPRPFEYHTRTEHCLPERESNIIPLLDEINNYTISHKMKINSDKSKCMLFNSARKFDFKPELYFDNSDQIKIVDSTKLLGVEIQSNLK